MRRAGERVEVAAIAPVHGRGTHQAQIRLVNQCRRLKAVTGPLAAHEASRSLTQFPVDQGSQHLEGGLIPIAPGSEPSGDVVVARPCSWHLAGCSSKELPDLSTAVVVLTPVWRISV